MNALSPEDRMRIKGVLERFGLPLQTSIDERHLLKAIAMDKKCAAGGIDLIIPHAIGDCRITPMPLDELQKYY
jgi:3-dehydroquinate synthetase